MDDTFSQHANAILEDGTLWLGDCESGAVHIHELRHRNITHVLIPAMISGFKYFTHGESGIIYRQLDIADISAFPIIPLFKSAFSFIDEARAGGGAVLVHCASGVSRSASFVIAYLMKENEWSYGAAASFVRNKRPCISSKFEHQLLVWEKMNRSLDPAKDTPGHKEARKAGYLKANRRTRDHAW